LRHVGIDPRRLALEWVSAAEAPRFVEKVTEFTGVIRELGPLSSSADQGDHALRRKIEAAKMAVSGQRMRTNVARQCKEIKENGTYGAFPAEEKLLSVLKEEITLYETLLCLKERDRPAGEVAELLSLPEDAVLASLETLKKKNLWPVASSA
jgi:F420-non-reducing hydrogenase iron-sulfur subunit